MRGRRRTPLPGGDSGYVGPALCCSAHCGSDVVRNMAPGTRSTTHKYAEQRRPLPQHPFRTPPPAPRCLARRRDVSLILLDDPDLRLRVCQLEELLCSRRSAAAANGAGPAALPQLQAALADQGFSLLFRLDSSVSEPDWGMQVGRGGAHACGRAGGRAGAPQLGAQQRVPPPVLCCPARSKPAHLELCSARRGREPCT